MPTVAAVSAVVAMVSGRGAWLAGAGLALLLWAGRRLSVLDHAVLVTSLPACSTAWRWRSGAAPASPLS